MDTKKDIGHFFNDRLSQMDFTPNEEGWNKIEIELKKKKKKRRAFFWMFFGSFLSGCLVTFLLAQHTNWLEKKSPSTNNQNASMQNENPQQIEVVKSNTIKSNQTLEKNNQPDVRKSENSYTSKHIAIKQKDPNKKTKKTTNPTTQSKSKVKTIIKNNAVKKAYVGTLKKASTVKTKGKNKPNYLTSKSKKKSITDNRKISRPKKQLQAATNTLAIPTEVCEETDCLVTVQNQLLGLTITSENIKNNDSLPLSKQYQT